MKQLRNKLRNKWGASKKAHQAKEVDIKSSASLISELMQSRDARTRKPQKIEAYLNLYYEERVRPAIEAAGDVQKDDAIAAVAADGERMGKHSPKLVTIMNKTREMFKKESAEVKAKVDEHWKEMVAERDRDKNGRKTGTMKTTQ